MPEAGLTEVTMPPRMGLFAESAIGVAGAAWIWLRMARGCWAGLTSVVLGTPGVNGEELLASSSAGSAKQYVVFAVRPETVKVSVAPCVRVAGTVMLVAVIGSNVEQATAA